MTCPILWPLCSGRDPDEALQREVVGTIVRNHLEELGEVFLYVLDAFSTAATEKGDHETAGATAALTSQHQLSPINLVTFWNYANGNLRGAVCKGHVCFPA